MKDKNQLLIAAVWIISAIAGVLAFTWSDKDKSEAAPATHKSSSNYNKGRGDARSRKNVDWVEALRKPSRQS